MVSYNLLIKRSAEKELRKIPKSELQRIASRIKTLEENSRPSGCQLLKGEDRFYRVRQGDYRIIYEVSDDERTVTIVKIGHRREVYD